MDFTHVYLLLFDEGDVGKNIIVFPRAQHENLKVNFDGYIVEGKEVEKNNLSFISIFSIIYLGRITKFIFPC